MRNKVIVENNHIGKTKRKKESNKNSNRYQTSRECTDGQIVASDMGT